MAAPPFMAATRGIGLRLEPRGTARNEHQFALVVQNAGPSPVELRLLAYDDSGRLYVDLPDSVGVPNGRSVSLVVRVTPRSRRWFGGTQQCGFRVEARAREGGPPLGAVGASVLDAPDPRGRALLFAGGGIVAAGVVAAVLAGAGVFGGDDPGPNPPVDPGESETIDNGATDEPGSPTEETPLGESPTVIESPGTPEPANSIAVGEWSYLFVVTYNECGASDPYVGQQFEFKYRYDEIGTPTDGYLTDGEAVRVTHIGGTYVANHTFTYPQFRFQYDLSDGYAIVDNVFDTAHHGIAGYIESHTLSDGSVCSIYAEDKG
jgi:hypothetical protein